MRSRESGLTLIELMVAMSLFLVAMAMFGASLFAVQRMQISSGEYSQANDEAHLALQAIDRQVRSGYVIKMQVPPIGTDAAVRIYTEAGGKPRCVMWVVADPGAVEPGTPAGTKWLYTTAWDPSGTDKTIPTSPAAFSATGKYWTTAATGLWNWLVVPTVPPFATPPETNVNVLQKLEVSFVLNASARPGASIEIGSYFTSRNVPRNSEGVTGLPGLDPITGEPTTKASVCNLAS